MPTNPRDAFTGPSSHQTPFHMLGIVFLLCNSNSVFKRRRFYDIRLKNVTLKSGSEVIQGTSGESGTIRNIVYGFLLMFFSNIVPKMHRFEIFDLKTAVTLKTGLGVRQGDWKCHHAIERI